MEDHTGDIPCNSDMYRKSFGYKLNFCRTWEVAFNCDVCRKIYSHKFRLTEHMMVYTVERPYICDLWGKVLHRNVY